MVPKRYLTDWRAGALRVFTSYLRTPRPSHPPVVLLLLGQVSTFFQVTLPRDRILQKKQWPKDFLLKGVTTKDRTHQQTDRADSVHTPGQISATY